VNQVISEAGRRIIDAVIEAPVAWRSPGELADRLGWTLEQTLDEIAELDTKGWLEAWELVDGPVVTLSVAATADCGVRLVEVGHDDTPKWARSGDPDPPGQRASGVFRSQKAASMGLVADGRPSAENAAILAEETENRNGAVGDSRDQASIEKLPKPTLLIGGGLSPWPGPLQADGQTCPACRSARLPARAYCLWCDRWGLDLDPDSTSIQRKKSKPTMARMHNPKADARRHESERRKRQQKRKERRSIQSRRLKPGNKMDVPFWSEPIAG